MGLITESYTSNGELRKLTDFSSSLLDRWDVPQSCWGLQHYCLPVYVRWAWNTHSLHFKHESEWWHIFLSKKHGKYPKYGTLSQQRRLASTWARRKTRISTPVATTTDAERQDARAGHMTSSGTWMMLDGCQTNHLRIYSPRNCHSCTLDALPDMFISFVPWGSKGCQTVQKRILCFSDWVKSDLMSNTQFSPSYISHLEPPSWTREVNISQPWLSRCTAARWEVKWFVYNISGFTS